MTFSPAAVITSARTRLSQVKPCRPDSQPMPPPSANPPTPVSPNVPPTTARWCAQAAGSTSSHNAPPPTRTSRSFGIDLDGAAVAQVDDQRAIGHGVPGDAVPAAADGDRQAEVGRSHHRGDHVVVGADPDDHGRPALDGRVERHPCRVILPVRGRQDAVGERLAQSVDDESLHAAPRVRRLRSPDTSDLQGTGLDSGRRHPARRAGANPSSHAGRSSRQATVRSLDRNHPGVASNRVDPADHPRPLRPPWPRRGPAGPAGGRDPRHDRPDRRPHRRPPRIVAGRGRADDRAPPPARIAA